MSIVKFQFLCPECKLGMIRRINRTTKKEFWGCTNYPECKGSRKLNGIITTPRNRDCYWLDKEPNPDYDNDYDDLLEWFQF